MDETKPNPRSDNWLERLLPMALERPTESEELQPPSPSEIDEYLNGGIDPARRKEIQQVLIRSPEQRKAVIQRGQDLQKARTQKPASFLSSLIRLFRGPMVIVPVAAVAIVIAGLFIMRNPEITSVGSMARVLTSVPSGVESIELPVLDSPRSSSGEGPVPTQISAETPVVINLPVVLFAGDPAPASAEIRDSADKTIWHLQLSPADIVHDELILEVDPRLMEPGDYYILVLATQGKVLARGAFRR
jgi:hypothetical protein